jgi:hypothetical protein
LCLHALRSCGHGIPFSPSLGCENFGLAERGELAAVLFWQGWDEAEL